jgi:hypothetical protein
VLSIQVAELVETVEAIRRRHAASIRPVKEQLGNFSDAVIPVCVF